MEIEQYLYDMNASGEAIVAYTMRSESGASVQLCNLGASVLALSLPNNEGRMEDVASGVSMRGVKALNGDFDGGINFAERIWESHVETNRVVMMLSYERDGVGIMNQAIFDFDDDNTLEITYIACVDQDSIFDLIQSMTFNLGADQLFEINGTGEQNIFRIDGAQPNILSEVATVSSTASGRKITILSSQPALYYNPQTCEIAPLTPDSQIVAAESRFIQKNVYRFLLG
ncbi:MAG: hypothetical protein R3Y39_01570 [Rikenellaceae bacterium]